MVEYTSTPPLRIDNLVAMFYNRRIYITKTTVSLKSEHQTDLGVPLDLDSEAKNDESISDKTSSSDPQPFQSQLQLFLVPYALLFIFIQYFYSNCAMFIIRISFHTDAMKRFY